MSDRRGRATANLLAVIAALALLLAAVTGYAAHVLDSPDQVAGRATTALGDAGVQALIADRVTDRVVAAHPLVLAPARPLIRSAVSDVVAGGAFGDVFRAAVRSTYAAVRDGSGNRITLTVGRLGDLIAGARVPPPLSGVLGPVRRVTLLSRRLGGLGTTVVRSAGALTLMAPVLGLLFLATAALAVAAAPRPAHGLTRLGAAILVAGLVLAVGLLVTRGVVINGVSGAQQQAAAGAVWDAFLGTLGLIGWILAAAGGALAVTAALGGARRRAPLRAR